MTIFTRARASPGTSPGAPLGPRPSASAGRGLLRDDVVAVVAVDDVAAAVAAHDVVALASPDDVPAVVAQKDIGARRALENFQVGLEVRAEHVDVAYAREERLAE